MGFAPDPDARAAHLHPVPMGLRSSGRTPSARELQVLEQVSLGLTNRDIGTELGISEQTVKNHVSSVLRKLSLNDRTQAVVLALVEGWISLPIGRPRIR